MSKRKNSNFNINYDEDVYDIASSRARNQKKNAHKRKRRNTKNMLRDFTDSGYSDTTSKEVEDINDWYGESLEKDW